MVRSEFDYNQGQMADILGVSKKTLVQIEKGRQIASWPVVVTFACIFRDSMIIQQELGEQDVVHFIQVFARKNIDLQKEGKVQNNTWWKTIDEQNSYILQRNVISHYFRIVDQFGYRLFSSFYKKSAVRQFNEIVKNKKDD
ncbi:transcriptional regulator [Filobacillus milosensis]|uniref:Transcriptional regulator n=2 Tax=Filobacillus milosensis TaxID=94137 RepID=A0A4Y8ITA8_9BACI|nr:transcriptional regulator [Filobacillus milosensis]